MAATAVTNTEWRLRKGHTHPDIPAGVKLGLNKIGSHKPKLKLADYIDPTAPAPPPAVGRPHPSFNWGMLANDQYGDCVCAMMLHSIEDFHLDAGTAVPAFTDQDALAYYHVIGGFDPNDPQNTDNGCDESTAMQLWESGGLPQTSDGKVHQIAATVSVDPSNLNECRIAIYEFADLQIGIALPLSAQGQQEWTVVGDPSKDPNSEPGSWGGHGIPFREYDADDFRCVTWGAELLLTVPFHQAYSQEAHVVVTQEMLNNSGTGPSGVQWSDLVSDINKLTAQAKPASKAASGGKTKAASGGKED